MDTSARDAEILQIVKQALFDVLRDSNTEAELRRRLERVRVETPLKSLGLDSMEVVEVAAYLEDAFGFRIPSDGIVADATVGDLIAALRELPAGAQAPDAELIPRFQTLGDLLRVRSEIDRERNAFTFLADQDGQLGVVGRFTYGALYQRSLQIAGWLRTQFDVGARIVLAAERPEEFVPLFFGCIVGGLVPVPVSRPSRRERFDKLKWVAEDSRAAAVVLGTAARANEPTIGDASALAGVRCLDAATLLGESQSHGGSIEPTFDRDALAFLQYTSGSTGSPKGVMVRHRAVLSNTCMIEGAFQANKQDTWVSWLPVYHDMGLIGHVIQPLYAGGSSVMMHPSAFIRDPLAWLVAVANHGGTISGAPNFAYDMCARAIDRRADLRFDLSRWRLAYNGAEPIREATVQRFARAFAHLGYRPESHFPCYGMAEATLFLAGGPAGGGTVVATIDGGALERGEIAACADPDGARARHIVACGRPARAVRCTIVNPETKRPCPASEVGEIWVSGPNLAEGYFGNPTETQEAFVHAEFDPGRRFLRTGDLGFVRDGQVYISGRLKDVVIVQGRNLHPQDIEDAASSSHEAFTGRRAAAFSVPGKFSESVVVMLETASQHLESGDHDALRDCVRQAVAGEVDAVVKDVVLVPPGALPMTTSGKVRRRECRERYLREST